MRVAHVAAYASSDNVYGGPLGVAEMQCRALAAKGHDVTLWVGHDGRHHFAEPSFAVRYFPTVALAPGRRLAAMTAPRMLAATAEIVRSCDLVQVHLGRDMITAPVARRLAGRIPMLIQPHGMVAPDTRLAVRVVDALLIKPTLRRAAAIFSLSELERRQILVVDGQLRERVVPMANAIAVEDHAPRSAPDPGEPPLIVFASRLHPRKGVRHFLDMASALHERGFVAHFAIAGADQGDLAMVHDFIAAHPEIDLVYLGALPKPRVLELLGEAALLVLPSVEEPFGMVLLEAMEAGTPVVTTPDNGIAPELAALGAAVLAEPNGSALADRVSELLRAPDAWAAMSTAGRVAVEQNYSIEVMSQRLEAAMLDATRRP